MAPSGVIFIEGVNMNKTVLVISISLISLWAAGCAGRIVHLENDQGTHLTCEVSTTSAMMTGVIVRDSSIDDCVRSHKAAGFKVTREE